MNQDPNRQLVDSIFHRAMPCRDCFEQDLAVPAFLDLPQPRGIGTEYFLSDQIEKTLHYAHRKGLEAEERRLRPLKVWLAGI